VFIFLHTCENKRLTDKIPANGKVRQEHKDKTVKAAIISLLFIAYIMLTIMPDAIEIGDTLLQSLSKGFKEVELLTKSQAKSYILKVWLQDTYANQNADQGQTLTAQIVVEGTSNE